MVIDFSIILLYFVEIYIHRIHAYKKMACGRVARRNGGNKNKRTKIAESRRKGIFLHFLLENCLGL